MEESILSSVPRMIWRLLESHDIDADAVFRQSGFDPAHMSEPRMRYPKDSFQNLWANVVKITGNGSIGIEAGRFYSPLDLSALGVSFLSSTTLMEALQRLRRYESIVNSNLTITLVETEQRVDVLSDANLAVKEVSKIHEDIRKAVVLDLCRKGLEPDLNPIEVAFTYPEPEDTSEYAAIFRCPLLFSQSVSRLSFSVDDTQRAFLTSNRELAFGNDQILNEMLSELKGSSLASQVKHVIIECLPSGTPTEKDIVERLFMSSRTLQRKLSDEGTNFRTLLLEARRVLAEQYISDKNMPLAEISYMLGFADQSSFFRAFKKWTGDSPSQFRDSLS